MLQGIAIRARTFAAEGARKEPIDLYEIDAHNLIELHGARQHAGLRWLWVPALMTHTAPYVMASPAHKFWLHSCVRERTCEFSGTWMTKVTMKAQKVTAMAWRWLLVTILRRMLFILGLLHTNDGLMILVLLL